MLSTKLFIHLFIFLFIYLLNLKKNLRKDSQVNIYQCAYVFLYLVEDSAAEKILDCSSKYALAKKATKNDRLKFCR